jgi:hypothetical protein
MIQKELHLIISAGIVFTVALVYGFQPTLLFDVQISSTDEHNILKSIMGLYLGFSTLWIIGILKPALWKTATISNIIFMLGLAFGRIISLFIDGIPSSVFILGTFGELILGFYGCYQIKKHNSQKLS